MLNKIQIIGHLGGDPEMRAMPSGDSVANFSVATTERWKDKQTGEQKEQTEWHRVAFFGRLAEICEQYLRKGSMVYIEGSIRTRKWQDQEGNDRYSTEIKGQSMKMLDKKGDNGGGQARRPDPKPESKPAQQDMGGPAPGPDDFDDDIPF